MIKQTSIKPHFSRPLVILAIAMILMVSILVAFKAMAFNGTDSQAPKGQTGRPMLTKAPTPSVTSSITNGVYVQDPKTKTFKRVSPETQQAKVTYASSTSDTLPAAVTPAGPKSLNGLALYVHPELAAQGRQGRIASQSTGSWFGGWNGDVRADVSRVVTSAAQSGTVPTLVAYNIPSRDCGSYSAGGSNSSAAYREWIKAFAGGIGANKAIVIVEPDALAGLDCLSADGQRQRLSDIAFAVGVLAGSGAVTYLDAGNYTWQSAATMAQRLKSANVASARGFSLNVSGYGWTDKSIGYGQQLVAQIGGGKGFVIDTSRNGNGPAPANEWCNPRGRALGKTPTTNTGVSGLDAYLWIKIPGESDGTCNGGPAAGQWWDDMANELIRNAS